MKVSKSSVVFACVLGLVLAAMSIYLAFADRPFRMASQAMPAGTAHNSYMPAETWTCEYCGLQTAWDPGTCPQCGITAY